MALHTPEQLTERLAAMRPNIRSRGAAVENRTEHKPFSPTLLSWGHWLYHAAFDEETAGTMVAGPDLNGEDCHVFWHMATSVEDLLQNLRAARLLAERSPLAGYASIGRDELQALLIITQDIDEARGTRYHERVEAYVRRFQREQVMTAAAVTDVKGDRGKRPSGQDDPDMYVHVVERNDDGIVVRGAKAHTSGSVGAEDLIVIPTRALVEGEDDYAVSFAVPVDAPGLRLVARGLSMAHASDEVEVPISAHDDLVETLTIFDDVFVPYERVFLLGEHEYAGAIANTFASVNRQGYLGTEVGKLRLFVGAAQRIAELNGVAHVSHIKDKIAQLIRIERTIWALGLGSSLESTSVRGFQVPDPVQTNAGKLACMEGHYLATRLLLEIAGGAVVTAPFVEDLRSEELADDVEKYFRGAEPGSAWERLSLLKFIRDIAASEYSGYWNAEIIHGSGSPAAEMLQLYREHDLDRCKELVQRAMTGKAAIGAAATVAP
jgi:4-hydroxybutyryl-CoA dehydratase / vinylacetyl-CoA-Delta-isomerase